MIKFVNAKINIGLNIVERRTDGYHNLETVFYPVGLECGLPHQPEAFDDILEIVIKPSEPAGCRFQFMGRRIDCPPEKNLVVKATKEFIDAYSKIGFSPEEIGRIEINLDKHLPDGAGLGGGSADAAFTLITLNELLEEPFSEFKLKTLARRLGADCPFFICNRPSFAEGIGEELTPIDVNLKGYEIIIVKPPIYISTKDAFSGIKPSRPDFDLRFLPLLPVEKWKDYVVNDFEKSLFPTFPGLALIKESLYKRGAVYASMTGSGSAIYGIFDDREKAMEAREHFKSNYSDVWLFGL